MVLEDKLFHGIKAYNYESKAKSIYSGKSIDEKYYLLEKMEECKEILLKLKSILGCNKILSREELYRQYPNNTFGFSSVLFSRNSNLISLTRHKSYETRVIEKENFWFGEKSVDYLDKELGYYIRKYGEQTSEEAYNLFVEGGLSLIFSKELLNRCLKGTYLTIEHEVLFEKEVPLDLLVGIGIPTWKWEGCRPFFGLNDLKNIEGISNVFQYYFIKEIVRMINNYNDRIKLISIENSKEYQENKEYERTLEQYLKRNISEEWKKRIKTLFK